MHIVLVLVVEGAARMRSYPWRGSVLGRPQHRFEDEDENAEDEDEKAEDGDEKAEDEDDPPPLKLRRASDEDDSQMSVIVIAANCTKLPGLGLVR